MDPPPDPPAPPRKFQTRRGVQRTSKADREAFARAEERRQAEAQREAERAASIAARRAYIPRGSGRGARRGNAAEKTRNENNGGVFGATMPAVGVGAGRGRGASRGRGGVANVEGLVGVKEEVPAEALNPSREGEGLGTRDDAAQPSASTRDGETKPTTTSANATIERKKIVKSMKKDDPLILSSDEEGLEEDSLRRDIESIQISAMKRTTLSLTKIIMKYRYLRRRRASGERIELELQGQRWHYDLFVRREKPARRMNWMCSRVAKRCKGL